MEKQIKLLLGLWLGGLVVFAQPAWAKEKTATIHSLNELEHPATTIKNWLSQVPQSPILVTGVKANPTSKGLELVLQTSKGQQLQLVNRSSGNSFSADIPNAQTTLTQWLGVHIPIRQANCRCD